MALKQDERDLKRKDRLWSILARLPGVELVNFDAADIRRLGSVIEATENVKPGTNLAQTVAFPEAQHPATLVLTTDFDGPAFVRDLADGVETMRSLLRGKSPGDFYPLPLIDPMYPWVISRHIHIDGFPVRVAQSYSALHQGYLTSFDAHRPAAGA